LGVTAIYFNPLNDAPTLHKYDARHWRHIDRNFGPDPEGDIIIMDSETPDDPTTWKMTSADSMFLEVIDEFHKRGIKVILDYSWNHTGKTCWAFQDIVEKGADSKYTDWYWIESFDDPSTPENEFKYKGWFGISELPEIKETTEQDHTKGIRSYEGNLYSEDAKKHIFNVTKRWLDPNNDGDPSDGVDGYRLDVAAELGLGFWRDYRKFVKSVNPDAYLLGEVWWEAWPDKLLDPEPYLKGDVFDAVMNYRWYRAARHFFAQAPDEVSVSEFVDSLKSFTSNIRKQNNYAMMNLAASHDAPRVSTSLYNKNMYKLDSKPTGSNNYKIDKPDEKTYQTLKMLLAQQFTYVGSPHIWAGDEMGMWGADDPSCRKPLIWPDYEFENETTHPLDKERPVNEVKFDTNLFNYYKKLIQIRKKYPVLSHGEIEYLIINNKNKVLAYSRYNKKDEIIAVFNASDETQKVKIPVKTDKTYKDILNDLNIESIGSRELEIGIPGRTAAIIAYE
jgi:glycosidase